MDVKAVSKARYTRTFRQCEFSISTARVFLMLRDSPSLLSNFSQRQRSFLKIFWDLTRQRRHSHLFSRSVAAWCYITPIQIIILKGPWRNV